MSLNRYARKTDTVQPKIVKELRDAHVEVIIIGKPVDLLCRLSHWSPNMWCLIEVKTPTKTGKIRKRNDQDEQTLICIDNEIPRLTSTEQVYEYLKSR